MKTKSRYFKAESREAAEAMAAKYFECQTSLITFEVMSGGFGAPEWEIFAFYGTEKELADANAGFGLFFEPDGVYMELYAERGIGEPLDRTSLSQLLIRKSIQRYDESAVKNLIANRSGRAKIAPAQQELLFNEDIAIDIQQHELEAHAKLLAPEPGGASLSFDDAKLKIAKAGITNGFDEQVLRNMLDEKRYGASYTIASATMPVDGEDGTLIFHFSTEQKSSHRPKVLEDGKVDFKSLDLYVPVEEGQLLVEKIPATEGTPGLTVKGKEIKQRQGKDVQLPKGKNFTTNDEKTMMYAKTSGMVEYVNGAVNVSNVYRIDGDVDVSVGNIDFDGSVHIGGNVITGHVIKATGGVVVGGVVEASEIIAGGNVEVKRGMQGMDRGRIEAGGSISLLYIERGTAIARGSVTIDASIHSVIEAGESLYAKGKRGSIIGGRAVAAGEISANSIGSVSHVQTEVEVGVMPQKRARLTVLEKEMERLNAEMAKLDQLDAYLSRAKEKLDAETYDKLYRSGVENRRIYTEQIDVCTEEMNAITRDLESATEGKVHVFDTVYTGARIIIADDMYKVNDEIKYATFKFKDGEVSYVPCEIKRGG